MKIRELMCTDVRTCRPLDSLADAAQAMWNSDVGWLPVVDESCKLVGVITDRDLAMSALMSGAPLWALNVGDAMAKVVYALKPEDKLRNAAKTMTQHQLRRLPVVDGENLLLGIVTLGSLAQAVAGKSALSAKEVTAVLAAVTSARPVPVSARLEVEVTRESLPTEVLQPAPRRARKGAPAERKPKARAKAKAKAAR